MIRPTLALLIQSTFPKAIGAVRTDLATIAAAANEAQESLLIDPLAPEEGWWGGWAHAVYTVTVGVGRYGYITTAADVARLIVGDVCGRPTPPRNGFYEYLEFSKGLRPKQNAASGGPRAIYERDNVVTLTDFPSTPQTLRFYPGSAADVGRKIVLQGKDQNGVVVYQPDLTTQQPSLGESIYLASPFVESAFTYSAVTGIMKQVTQEPVTIFAVDASTGTATALSSMEPGEVTASYRRYLLDGLPDKCCRGALGSVQVDAQVKFDYVPVVNPVDYLCIPCIPALIEEAQSKKYSRQDTKMAVALEQKHHAKALALLNGQLDHYQGKTQTAVSVPLFGSQRLRRQPV